MSAGLESRRDDHIDLRRLERHRLLRRRRRSDQHDAFAAALVEDLLGRDAEDEAERRDLRIDDRARLIFELDRRQ